MKNLISYLKPHISNLLLLAALILVACHQNPRHDSEKTALDSKLLISCKGVGEVQMSDSYKDLEKKFGAAALSSHENTVSGQYTILWEKKPEQVNIYWQENKAPFKKIKYIEIENDGSPYQTENGLRLGLSLRDVVKINGGMPVTFHNFFAGDANGRILSFNNGDIQKNNPCLSGNLEIAAQRNININELKELRKQETLESYDHYMERIDATLVSIRVYPDNYPLPGFNKR